MNHRYYGQTVLVTGGAQGLGLAMARRFAAEGATVHVADRNTEALEEIETEITRGGGRVQSHRLDVGRSREIDAWVGAVVDREGRIDVLINNAGIIRDERIERIGDEAWDDVIAVNLTGAFYGIRAVLPHMKERGYGRIVSFSSMSWRGNFGQANYAAAKAGIVGLTRTAALEGARSGITANAIAPGLIETPMLASMNAAARTKLVGRVPLGHIGDPADIANAAVFLASREAGYITGVILDVDGGIGIGSSVR
ncbi:MULTISPECIES: SDR family NAD(P)-dependent oxidoreductase [unclassified Brevibacterium]|uniref:SDR family NAD(P)-dependent oxidoreductase n=1 Tax=unclassified Brevibacterium TaxID=2614124 RepID=UPI0010F73AB0|nr:MULTISPECIES: SDR family NAD(P)-dependent oxidoreductase [unclassified Brevibacterium]MCM1013564.1 SDR family oxidoreductase [Brevibacterium sp. XM4083]